MFARFFAQMPPQPDTIQFVDPATVRSWMESGDAFVIDVRETGERMAEHIPGTLHMPLSTFDPARITVPAGKKLVIHCRSGQRCGMAAMKLAMSGYSGEIHRMYGGIMNWRASGLPVKAGP